MKRIDFIFITLLIIAATIIFYPIFYTQYLYTDEATQLWNYNSNLNFQTSVPQGRYLSYKIFGLLFKSITTVQQVIYARLFSLLGWLICLPVWYYIINKVAIKNGLSKAFVVLVLVYIISMPPFTVYAGWAACLEVFIACTTGLAAGYILYVGIKYNDKIVHVSTIPIIASLVFGAISLFTYQNGFGCFFIPFFIHFISIKKITKHTYIGVVFSIFIYAVYFFLFKYTLHISALPVSSRSSFTTDPVNKLLFLFTRPLATAFHFTYLFNEKSIAGIIAYIIIAAAWFVMYLVTQKAKSFFQKTIYLCSILIFFILIYLPSLIVKENYSSNRTLIALDIAVFMLVAETIYQFIKTKKARYILTTSMALFFLINAWYNYNQQFLNPLSAEFNLINTFILQKYQPNISAIYIIRPSEDAFVKKYNIVASWDEFGVPSAAKYWVPEPLIKQLIYEKTGSRQTAENVVVKSWADREAFQTSGIIISEQTLFFDLQEMILRDSVITKHWLRW